MDKVHTNREGNYKERISSLGKQSALWAVAAVGSLAAGALLALNVGSIALPVGGVIAAYSGFKAVQKLYQRHNLHKEVTAIADDLATPLPQPLGQAVAVPQQAAEPEITSTYWRDNLRANQLVAQGTGKGV